MDLVIRAMRFICMRCMVGDHYCTRKKCSCCHGKDKGGW